MRVDVLKYIEAEKYLITMFIDNKDTAWVEFDKEQLRGLIKLLNEQSTKHEGTMKPFNLEAAKAGDKIITRSGHEATFIAYVPELDYTIRVLYHVGGMINACRIDGFVYGVEKDSPLDLFMATKKRTVWVNLYPNSHNSHWRTEEAANIAAGTERIGGKAYPVEIEE